MAFHKEGSHTSCLTTPLLQKITHLFFRPLKELLNPRLGDAMLGGDLALRQTDKISIDEQRAIARIELR